ncbi:MAG: hypothetical protein JWM32_2593 [Verrucomicrobia bacterium]|nr:hypothetical protein [Verrucomicrobiota bacterium]
MKLFHCVSLALPLVAFDLASGAAPGGTLDT